MKAPSARGAPLRASARSLLLSIGCAALLSGSAVFGSGCAVVRPGVTTVDMMLFPEPPKNAITFWGHSSVYLDLDGFGIVTDPVYEPGYAMFHPRVVSAPPRTSYDQARVVLISHAHHDHLNRNTMQRFAPGVIVLCPAPAARYLKDLDREVRAMRPGDEYAIPGGRIVAVAASHPGGRMGMRPKADGGALGWIIQTAKGTVYYAGDTNYFPGFEEVGQRYHPDIALLNVNVHIHSMDALRAITDLGMPAVIPIHFGAYASLKRQTLERWRDELSAWLGPRVIRLEPGQSVALATALHPVDRGTPATQPALARAFGISRFATVDDGLARGARPDNDGVSFLARQGYRTVVSFARNDKEKERVEAAGMRYVEIPLHAGIFSAGTPSDEDLSRFFDVVLDSTARPVFMHCVHGKDRTGAMAALYRIEVCGWTSAQAVEEMKRFGFSGHYRKLRRFVEDYAPRRFEAKPEPLGRAG